MHTGICATPAPNTQSRSMDFNFTTVMDLQTTPAYLMTSDAEDTYSMTTAAAAESSSSEEYELDFKLMSDYF